jgi:hypothetical protein
LAFHTWKFELIADRQAELTETQIRNGHRIENTKTAVRVLGDAVNWTIPVTDHTLRIIKQQDTTVVYPSWGELQKQKGKK